MNLNDFRNLFVVSSLVLILLVISPTLNLFFPLSVEESFSALSIIGPNRLAKDYPFNVIPNREERLFVTVDNNMGESSYYRIYVKFRNQTQSSPKDNEPSLLTPLYEYRVFLVDGGTFEGELNFNFLETIYSNDTVLVKKLMINNQIFELDSFCIWDYEYGGFYFQLFFELWLYDVNLHRFNYYDRGFVGLWLNMTV